MYDTILFPTNGDEGTAVALEHAIDLARRHEATIDVLVTTAGDDDDDDVNVDSTLEEAASSVRDAGVTVNTVRLEGSPREKIADYVRDRGVDIVVMGTHGRRGLERYVEGSVTETVLRNVTVPVLVVPMNSAE